MADNIRTTLPDTFSNQDWQTPKVRATPGTATPDEIAHKATAEWANAVDEAQREINKAFYGFPQQAVSTRGWVRGSNTALTDGTTPTQTIQLVKNVGDAEFVQVDIVIAARRVTTPSSWSHHEVALFQLTGGAFVRKATELSVEQAVPSDNVTWLDGADMVFPAVAGTSTLAVTVTGPTSGEQVRWTVDFSVRSGPSGLNDDAIVGT